MFKIKTLRFVHSKAKDVFGLGPASLNRTFCRLPFSLPPLKAYSPNVLQILDSLDLQNPQLPV